MRRAIALLLVLIALPAQAELRALVIGNANYAEAPDLANPPADAAGYAETLAALGFIVTVEADLDRDGFEEAVIGFADSLAPGDTAVFVYSGHGWSDGSANYLLPTDIATSASQRLAARRSIPLKNGVDGVLDLLRQSGAGLRVAIVDACRNNVFDPGGTRSFGQTRGLARIDATEGSFVIFSAAAGQTALDRLKSDPEGQRLSVFARTLLPQLRSGVALEDAMLAAQVETNRLARAQGHPQRPTYYKETIGKTCLTGTCTKVALVQPPDPCSEARAVWDTIKGTADTDLLKTFLGRYPACEASVTEAGTRLNELLAEEASRQRREAERREAEARAAEGDAQRKRDEVRALKEEEEATRERCIRLTDQVAGKDRFDLANAISACRDAANAAPDDAGLTYRVGVAFFDAGMATGARAYLQRATRMGSAPAAMRLGVLLADGFGVPPDPATAARHFQTAAEAGIADASWRLALLYSEGAGVPADPETAATHYMTALQGKSEAARDGVGELSRAAVREVQVRLNRLGHYHAAIDGIAGEGTRAAVRSAFGTVGEQANAGTPEEFPEISAAALELFREDGYVARVLRTPVKGTVVRGTLHFRFRTACEKDLFAEFRDPSGHNVVVMDRGLKRCSGSMTTFTSRNATVVSQFFKGRQAGGDWLFLMRDLDKNQHRGTLEQVTLELEIRTGDGDVQHIVRAQDLPVRVPN